LSESANQVFLVRIESNRIDNKYWCCFLFFEGFTYVAPSIILDMTRTSKRANNSNENLNILTNDFNNISTIKTIKSATLNRHHLNKSKSPGNWNKFSLSPPKKRTRKGIRSIRKYFEKTLSSSSPQRESLRFYRLFTMHIFQLFKYTFYIWNSCVFL